MNMEELWSNEVCKNFYTLIGDTSVDDIPKVIFGEKSPIYWMALKRILMHSVFNTSRGNKLRNRIIRSICENGYFQLTTAYAVDFDNVPQIHMMDYIPNVRWYTGKSGRLIYSMPHIKYVYPEDDILPDVACAVQYKNPMYLIVRAVNTNIGTPNVSTRVMTGTRIFSAEGTDSSYLSYVYNVLSNLSNPYAYWISTLTEPNFGSILSPS